MVAQSEREPGVIDMGEGLLDPMAQDEEVVVLKTCMCMKSFTCAENMHVYELLHMC